MFMLKDDEKIVKINLERLSEEAIINVGGLPTSIKVSNDNQILYVCTTGG